MGRTSPRTNIDSPVILAMDTNIKVSTNAQNIGIGGILIKDPLPLTEKRILIGGIIQLKINLPNVGEMNLWGKVLRLNNDGLAVQFGKLNEGDQIKLWHLIKERLEEPKKCPYCGRVVSMEVEECEGCGWNLNFTSNNYLKYMKREGLTRVLINSIHHTSDEQLHHITEILNLDKKKEGITERTDEVEEFVGTCESIVEIFSQIRKVAQTDLPVLILGETGTGKELTARAIHERSMRNNKPFVPINCAAIPETLLEAELFGYEKGAYTGALTSKGGKIEQADGGTLFLDEVVELPTNLQSKLLRFLDDQVVERLGSRKSRMVDLRVIAATNIDLEKAISKESLRPDFYHRLKVFTINLVPLRDRGDDKLILSKYFIKKFCREMEIPVKEFNEDAIKAIKTHSWPGNVREMINKIRRALVMNQGGAISTEDLELSNLKISTQHSLIEMKGKIERDVVVETLTQNRYNISRTARSLSISRPHLYSLIKRYNIKREAKQT